MKDAVSRRSRGFGFITYMNTASVDAALSVDQHIVDNRRVEAKRAVPRSEVPSKVPVAKKCIECLTHSRKPGDPFSGIFVLETIRAMRLGSTPAACAFPCLYDFVSCAHLRQHLWCVRLHQVGAAREVGFR